MSSRPLASFLLALLICQLASAACTTCMVATCNNLAVQMSAQQNANLCSTFNEVGFIAQVTKGPDCANYVTERFCTFYKAQSDFQQGNQCSVNAQLFCRSLCNVRAGAIACN